MCGLFGMIDCGGRLSKRQKSSLLHALATAAEQRGTDASGIAYPHGGRLHVIKRPIPGRRLRLSLPEGIGVIIGHTRMSTQGDAHFNRNNHPFTGCVNGRHFALAHNGVLYNDSDLRVKHHLPKTTIETDSYVAVQLIEKEKSLSFHSLKTMAEEVRGTFTFTVLDDSAIWFVKGDSPLCLRYYPRVGVYLYASTELILEQALARTGFSLGKYEEVEVEMGQILRVDTADTMERGTFSTAGVGHSRFLGVYSSYITVEDDNDMYLDELRYMASFFGYSPQAVDRLLAKGYSVDEIEDALYGMGARRGQG